jgi:membrane fusion protein (multidrug efflux system)
MSWLRIPAIAMLLAVSNCGDSQNAKQAAPPTPAVTVAKVVSQDIKPAVTFTGRVEAENKVALRARIEGFLQKRLFAEGADVKDGDLMFVIEKAPYQAALDQAKASLLKAEAALKLADIEVNRQTELLQKKVIAQAKVDEVTAKQGQARGAMLAEKAAVEKAELQLGYTDVRAPLAGRVGRENVSVGNFVGPSTGPLATIVSQDPIDVTFPVTQREMLEFRKEQEAVGSNGEVDVYLTLADGSRYPAPGKIDFDDVTVNQGTDTVLVRATFPNPKRILVDGQLVTVVAEPGKPEPALMVPQQALQLDQAGAFVLLVNKENKVEVRRVETGATRGANIAVTKGLKVGEAVITEGIQRVRPGQIVNPAEARPEA